MNDAQRLELLLRQCGYTYPVDQGDQAIPILCDILQELIDRIYRLQRLTNSEDMV